MASNHDVREWARQTGIDVADSGPLPADVKRAYEAYAEGAEPESVLRYTTETGDPEAQEVKPVIKVSLADRVKETRDRVKPPARVRRKSPAKKPAKPRASIERIASFGWSMLGAIGGKASPAVGYMMEKQAPVVGMVLEDSIKGSIVDRMIQPFAHARDSGVVISAIFGPPVLTAALQFRPDKADFILPALRESLMMWMELAGDKIVIAEERKAEFEDKYGETVDAIIAGLLLKAFNYVAEDVVQPA
jgi:hypothetical protein